MKKWMLLILALAAPAFADIAVTPGVGKTVATETNNSREYQVVEVVSPGGTSSMTITAVGLKVDLTTTSITQGGTLAIISTAPYQVYTSSFGVNGSSIAAAQLGTWNIGTVTTLTGITNALPAGTNVIGGVTTTQTSSETVLGIGENAYANNGSAWTQGQPSQQAILTKSGMLSTWSGPDITFPSYTASTGTLASAASATDIAELCGNASNTVLVYDIRASCTETTAGNVLVKVIKRSTADTGVIASSFTSSGVSDDSSYAVAISTFALYTANPTVGTTAVLEDAYQLGCMASATATPNDVYISPASWRMKPIVLRGAAQCLAFNLNGATVTGGAWTITYKWLELQTP